MRFRHIGIGLVAAALLVVCLAGDAHAQRRGRGGWHGGGYGGYRQPYHPSIGFYYGPRIRYYGYPSTYAYPYSYYYPSTTYYYSQPSVTYVVPSTSSYYAPPATTYTPPSVGQPDYATPAAFQSPAVTEAGKTASLAVNDNFFAPTKMQVSVGTTVTWTNRGSNVHTVTSATGSWDSGDLQPGMSFGYAFTKPGTYAYYDKAYPNMRGEIVVQ